MDHKYKGQFLWDRISEGTRNAFYALLNFSLVSLILDILWCSLVIDTKQTPNFSLLSSSTMP